MRDIVGSRQLWLSNLGQDDGVVITTMNDRIYFGTTNLIMSPLHLWKPVKPSHCQAKTTWIMFRSWWEKWGETCAVVVVVLLNPMFCSMSKPGKCVHKMRSFCKQTHFIFFVFTPNAHMNDINTSFAVWQRCINIFTNSISNCTSAHSKQNVKMRILDDFSSESNQIQKQKNKLELKSSEILTLANSDTAAHNGHQNKCQNAKNKLQTVQS